MSPLDVEVAAPASELVPRFRRRLAVLVGLVAVAAASLAFLESDADRQEDQARIDASRTALDVFVGLAASGPRFQFEVDAARRSTLLDARSNARAAGISLDPDSLGVALGLSIADNEASRELLEISRATRSVPRSAPGLDQAASDSIRIRSQADVDPLLDAQADASGRAERFGTRQERAMFGIALVAIAASLVGLAGLIGAGRAGTIVLATAAAALALGVGWGGSGLLV